ncbi:MAG: response regulator [Anaerolineales bacterium]|nr:response regulator [Anaerolineales bacterium]
MSSEQAVYKILVVDDDLDTLRLVGTTLEKQGYQIIPAKDGVEALERAAIDAPDLILLDVMMPGINGYEVTRRLRQEPRTAKTPIILFTAKAQVDDKVAGLEAGANEYLTKPTHPAELVARVRSLLKQSTGGPPSPAAPGPLHNSPGDSPPPAHFDSGRGQMYGVIAAKGGQGVSSLSINLGATLHQQYSEQGVIVAEMRPGHGDISAWLGYTNAQGMNDLLRIEPSMITANRVEQALVAYKSGLKLLLASNRPSDASLVNAHAQLEAVVSQLPKLAAHTVLDLGVGMPLGIQRAVQLCNRVLLVVEPDVHTMPQTKALLQDLLDLGISKSRILGVLMSRVRTEMMMNANEAQKELGIELEAVFTPAPELAYQAARTHQPMVSLEGASFTSQQADKLAKLLTQGVPLN